MSKLDRVIKQLEQGKELCGICGKDVTGAPECMHSHYPLMCSNTAHAKVTTPDYLNMLKKKHEYQYYLMDKDYEKSLYSMRIGEEMLLYSDEEIKALPMFDMTTVSVDVAAIFQMADAIDRAVLNLAPWERLPAYTSMNGKSTIANSKFKW